MLKRRYEILLPLKFNDGQKIPDELLKETWSELIERFDGLSWTPQPIQGVWSHEGVLHEDATIKLAVDVEDLPEHRQFFVEYKPVLMQRFQQLEVYIVSYPIERI